MDRHEQLRLKQEQRNVEREQALQAKLAATSSRRRKLLWGLGSLAVIIVIIAGVVFALPGKLDGFAQCLTEKGAVMYGAIEWCQYTKEQAGMFGKSFKYLDYRDYRDLPGIKKTPTWQIDGQLYENVQSLQRLSSLTGCPL
ncbi:hypothetical protein HY492_00995 [Candidatus Woesearchaeota archaeon]|nr:hypothetical protein [Candidatus Woesearchaeota archaeon]